MGLAAMFHQYIGKRTSTFALAICVGAIGFERGFDRLGMFILPDETQNLNNFSSCQSLCFVICGSCSFADYLWETQNKGKLWKDIRVKYETESEEEA